MGFIFRATRRGKRGERGSASECGIRVASLLFRGEQEEEGGEGDKIDDRTRNRSFHLQHAAIISFYGNSACSSYYDGAPTTITETASIKSDCQRTRGYIYRKLFIPDISRTGAVLDAGI